MLMLWCILWAAGICPLTQLTLDGTRTESEAEPETGPAAPEPKAEPEAKNPKPFQETEQEQSIATVVLLQYQCWTTTAQLLSTVPQTPERFSHFIKFRGFSGGLMNL